MKKEFNKAITAPQGNQGFGLDEEEIDKEVAVNLQNGENTTMKTGAIAIACDYKLYKYF